LVGDGLVRNLTGGKSEVGKFSWEKGVAKRVVEEESEGAKNGQQS
jgi:hypothetical protein